ncbi:ribosome-recycling factor, partial [Granulicatella elegans]
MTATEIIANAKERMKKTEDALQRELGGIRAGRANASLLDRLQVEYYGVPTPVNQLASVTVPEARMLLITPYDKSSLQDIERAILMSDIG